jgi:hypothetical protein
MRFGVQRGGAEPRLLKLLDAVPPVVTIGK